MMNKKINFLQLYMSTRINCASEVPRQNPRARRWRREIWLKCWRKTRFPNANSRPSSEKHKGQPCSRAKNFACEKKIFTEIFSSQMSSSFEGKSRFTSAAFSRFIDVSARPISKQEIFHARKKASRNVRARTSGLLSKLDPLIWFPSAHIYGL